MAIYKARQGDAALVSLDQGDDLLEGLTKVAKELEMHAGTIEVIGALRKLRFGIYDLDRKEYDILEPQGHFELLNGTGNVALKDGEPFVHLHVTASGSDGTALGGHAMPGCEVFVAEAIFRIHAGNMPVRELDPSRGLALW